MVPTSRKSMEHRKQRSLARRHSRREVRTGTWEALKHNTGGLNKEIFNPETPKGWKAIKPRHTRKVLLGWRKTKEPLGREPSAREVFGSGSSQSYKRLVLALRRSVIGNQMNSSVSEQHRGHS